MGPWKLIKMARTALQGWRALPGEKRERVRDEADRVRDLSIELTRAAGRRTARPRTDCAVQAGAGQQPSREELTELETELSAVASEHELTAVPRDVKTVAAELQAALATLTKAAGSSTLDVAKSNSRAVRWGSRAASLGARHIGRRDD